MAAVENPTDKRMERLTKDVKNELSHLITKGYDYKNFYVESGWNTGGLVDTGIIVDIESGITKPFGLKDRMVTTVSPKAAVLIKKKAFSSLRFLNDMRYMSKNEIFLLRATKALFALKVQQIRTYETLYKAKEFSSKNENIVNISQIISLIDKLNRAQSLSYKNSVTEFENEREKEIYGTFVRNLTNTNFEVPGAFLGLDSFTYQEGISDLMSLLKRNIYSHENLLTTFIVDHTNIDNYGTGPGTGVIELTNFSNLSCNISHDSNPSSLSMSLQDPYNISIISESDIDLAIAEALEGNCGIFKNLLETDISLGMGLDEFGVNVASSSISEMSSSPESFVSGNSIKSLENFYSKVKRSKSEIDIDYVFERLRVFYLGKPYVNPADTINVFMQGNRSKFFSPGDPMGNSSVKGVKDEINGLSEAVLEAERDIYTSGKVDLKTYKLIRETNEYSLGMFHVFGGFVTNSSTSYNQGSYTFNFSCTDNMSWLTWSRFNEVPSIDDPQGVLEDPLTPFKIPRGLDGEIDFSRPPELLDENKELIESGLLSYDSGLLRGQNVKESNLLQSEFAGIGSSDGQRILQHPSGFIYDWKTGILTATAKFEPTSTSDGDNRANYSTYTQNYVLPTVKNVLNNLDVANIISILTTGKPYNVVNFLKNAKEAINFMPEADRAALKNVSQNPLSSVVEIINKQNDFYGGFVPYKMITSGSQSYQRHITNSALKETVSSQIRDLEIKRAEIRDRIDKLKGTGSTIGSSVSQSADNIIKRFELQIEEITQKINNEVGKLSGTFGILSANTPDTPFGILGNTTSEGGGFMSLSKDTDQMKKVKSLVGTLRRIEDVRLNRDTNYFVVSDQYDVSVEIKPFLLELKNSNYKLFQSTYANNFDKCRQAAAFLNLEFFCNSQGHLELRPPQWNKIPLSVLRSLIKTKKTSGKNVIPDYILNLYETKEKNIAKEIQRLNVRIVIICLLLGRFPDALMIPGLSNYLVYGQSALSFFGVSWGGESGINATSTGISTSDFRGRARRAVPGGGNVDMGISFDLSENGNFLNGDVEAILGDFNPELSGSFKGVDLKEEGRVNDGNTLGGSGLINEILLYSKGSISAPAEKIATKDNVNKIRREFFTMFGIDPAKDLLGGKEEFEDEDFVFKTKSETYVEKITKIIGSSGSDGSLLSKLKSTISERDKSVILLKRNRDKKESFNEINAIFSPEDNKDDLSKYDKLQWVKKMEDISSYIADTLNYNRDPSSPYDELIEDDTTNLLGYGSGKRFIVKDEDIISATYSENPPEYTRVNVTGSAELGIGDNLQSISEGYYLWAGASDFDLWRQFGYKPQSFSVPFFSSAESQCKPYAYFMLQLQRSKINTGTIQVVGNEFYQPGDVIYVESKGLLYYVKSVGHNMSYGQSFVTSLTLEYGHAPGVYMPNPLDLFGMQLTGNITSHNIPVYRNSRGDDYYRELSPESTLRIPRSGFNNISKFLSHSDNQSRFYTMMIGLTSGSIIGGNKKLLIRGFIKESNPEKISLLRDSLKKIKDLFANPQILSSGSPDRVSGLTTDEFLEEVLPDNSGLEQKESSSLGKIFSSALSSVNPMTIAEGRSVPLKLPNGQLAAGINPDDIIIQITNLKKDDDSGEITCAGGNIAASFTDDSGLLTNAAKVILPTGGMRQSTWLDWRNLDTGIFSGGIIYLAEIGIVDLKRYNKLYEDIS